MRYPCGNPVRIGDPVLIESGRTSGVIEAVIETAEDMREWQVDEPGVLVRAEPFGLVFWPASDSAPVILAAR
jgi:hypothetical protein